MALLLDLDPPFLVIRPGVTEEQFYDLADEDSDWEYLDGRLVMHSPASLDHEDLFRFLLCVLSGFLNVRRFGRVLGSRYPMRLSPTWSPEPDLLVVLEAHASRLTENRLEGSADLVVEIASQGNDHLLRTEKLPRYREARIPEIWVADPLRRELRVEALGGAEYELRVAPPGRVESRVLPGFWLDASWLFARPRPPESECLAEILGTR